jgi:hypothetical protein
MDSLVLVPSKQLPVGSACVGHQQTPNFGQHDLSMTAALIRLVTQPDIDEPGHLYGRQVADELVDRATLVSNPRPRRRRSRPVDLVLSMCSTVCCTLLDTDHSLLRSLPNLLTAADQARIRDARPADPGPAATAEPLRVDGHGLERVNLARRPQPSVHARSGTGPIRHRC